MSDIYEESRTRMQELVEWYKVHKGNRNEATTRFQLIERTLLDCLGWGREEVTSEDSYNGEYSDYTFRLIRPTLILEAKKEGNYFELPEGNDRLIYSLKSLCKDNKNLFKSLMQVSNYCQQRGIEIGAVSNGWQFVLFIANRIDGTPPLEGRGFVFPSLEFINKNFIEFWNVFSKPALSSKKFLEKLTGQEILKLPPKLSSSVLHYPGFKNRNPFQTDLQIISEIVLEDVANNREIEKEFLALCYCKSGALSQYALISKEILRTRYKYLFEINEQEMNVETAVEKKGLSTDLTEIIASSLSNRPILLVGDVGVGKTIFINNLIKIEAESVIKDAITLRVDLGSQVILAEKLEEAVIEQLIPQLLGDYSIDIDEESFIRGVYNGDLNKFRNGIYKPYFESKDTKAIEKEIEFLEHKIKNRPEHIKQSLIHISKARKKQIIIFIDNVDQRETASQQKAFLVAQEMAENWPVTVFLALRPGTFHWSLKFGALSGYHPKAFTISPPRIDEVLEKRLAFAQKITRGEIFLTRFDGKVKINLENLDCLIEIIKQSFGYNRDLLEFIDNISNGNIRIAIDFLKGFIGSSHVDTRKIIEIYQNTGSYYIPLHEFLRAIIYGDNVYYDPKSSYIVNLFDVSHYDQKEHFLLPLLLSLLSSTAKSGISDGFAETNKIYSSLQGLGYTVSQIDLAIIKSYENKLVETSAKGIEINKDNYPSLIRITSMGLYHFEKLLSSFVYLDAVVIDTPIFDENFRQNISDSYTIIERLERAIYFKDYLDKVWADSGIKNPNFDWNLFSSELNKGIKTIQDKIVN